MQRSYFRRADQIRPMAVTAHISTHADGSVLFEQGKTKVLCTVTQITQIPQFLRNKKKWWLTASYSLLPASTHLRTERETQGKRHDRSIEISRLIGRSLRSIVNLDDMPDERTIHVDCDVIQADGGTRTASITGAFAALVLAEKKWLEQGIITKKIITHDIAAVSVGCDEHSILLDIDFAEDSSLQADFNFVMTRDGAIIEMQGCGEKEPVDWETIMQMKLLAHQGIKSILAFLDQELFKVKKSTHSIRDQSLVS